MASEEVKVRGHKYDLLGQYKFEKYVGSILKFTKWIGEFIELDLQNKILKLPALNIYMDKYTSQFPVGVPITLTLFLEKNIEKYTVERINDNLFFLKTKFERYLPNNQLQNMAFVIFGDKLSITNDTGRKYGIPKGEYSVRAVEGVFYKFTSLDNNFQTYVPYTDLKGMEGLGTVVQKLGNDAKYVIKELIKSPDDYLARDYKKWIARGNGKPWNYISDNEVFATDLNKRIEDLYLKRWRFERKYKYDRARLIDMERTLIYEMKEAKKKKIMRLNLLHNEFLLKNSGLPWKIEELNNELVENIRSYETLKIEIFNLEKQLLEINTVIEDALVQAKKVNERNLEYYAFQVLRHDERRAVSLMRPFIKSGGNAIPKPQEVTLDDVLTSKYGLEEKQKIYNFRQTFSEDKEKKKQKC